MKQLICIAILLFAVPVFGAYDIPNNNADCPDNCRQVNWSAGLDPEGGIPTDWVDCTHADCVKIATGGAGPVNATTINAAISSAGSQEVVNIKAGTHTVSATLNMKSNVIVRGAGLTTILNLTGGSGFLWDGSRTHGSEIDMTADPDKGDSSFTLANVTGLSVGDYVSIYQDNDSSIPVDASNCGWCGEDSGDGRHSMQQFAKITSVNDVPTECGTTPCITIHSELYYDYDDSANDAALKKVTFAKSMSGVEDLKIDGTNVDTSLMTVWHSRHIWIKNVETYLAGSNSGEGHLVINFAHGVELRDSYLHHGHGNGSGQNYVYALYWNSEHKIVNNVFESLRHVTFEGGGAGSFVGYNYMVDCWESEDSNFLSADANPNHGPHPHMNLWEGNISSKFVGDNTMGSSSHIVAFRNWITGTRGSPAFTWGVWAVDLQEDNKYYTLVGNIIGNSGWTTGTVTADGDCEPTEPTAYKYGCDGQPGTYDDSSVAGSTVRHGNYDYITDGVAHWVGGEDYDFPASYYYASKQACIDDGVCASGDNWPMLDVSKTNMFNRVSDTDYYIPAYRRHESISEPPASGPTIMQGLTLSHLQ